MSARWPLRLALLAFAGCIDFASIDVRIIGDSGSDTGTPVPIDTGETGRRDTAPPESESAPIDTDTALDTDMNAYTGPALGDDVLIYQGDGAMPVDAGPYLIDGVEELTAQLNGLGAWVDMSETWPDDPGAYRLALWYLPTSNSPEGTVVPDETLLKIIDWMGRGGRLVIAGDVDGEYAGYSLTRGNDAIDQILARLGVQVRIDGDLNEKISCAGASSHPIMADEVTLGSYTGNDLVIGAPAEWLYCDILAVQNVACGELVVSGDVNLVSDRPDLSPQLVENLYSVPVTSSCG